MEKENRGRNARERQIVIAVAEKRDRMEIIAVFRVAALRWIPRCGKSGIASEISSAEWPTRAISRGQFSHRR